MAIDKIFEWWHILVIPVLQKLKQEEHEFKDSLGYIVKFSNKTKQNNQIKSVTNLSYSSEFAFYFAERSVENFTSPALGDSHTLLAKQAMASLPFYIPRSSRLREV